jgi:dipeptidyl aminopeptidase/acylaminoacyl peptidase
MWRGAGFAKHHVSWPSGGQTMTGTISIPDGGGPFPVVIVNHGHIPSDRYWIGQDSGIFGDPMAVHGFISIAPNYPGYSGSGPGAPGLTTNQQIAVIDMDLASSLASLPQADVTRLAVVGHSQGGGVSQILLVVDPRFKAVVLHAPVSSDEAENARRLHDRNGTWPAAGDPAQNPDYYAHASPRNYFAAGEAPVLLVQGTLDHTIPSAHTQATYDALTAKGVDAQLKWVQGGDHDLVGANLDAAVTAQEAWIRKALGL